MNEVQTYKFVKMERLRFLDKRASTVLMRSRPRALEVLEGRLNQSSTKTHNKNGLSTARNQYLEAPAVKLLFQQSITTSGFPHWKEESHRRS